MTTTGDYLVVTFREDSDVYDILLAGSIEPPPDVVDERPSN
ncbi:MAG: hypothetical protein ACYCO3_15315 [Mycobacteriales bacterium]